MKIKAIKVKKVLSNLPIISVGFVSNPELLLVFYQKLYQHLKLSKQLEMKK